MSARYIPKERSSDWSRFEMSSLGRAPSPSTGGDRENAERDGLAAGYQAGFARGQAAAGRLAALLRSFEQATAAYEQKLAGELVELSLEIARQMLRGDVEGRRTALLAVLRDAIAALPSGLLRPSLVLHPADAELVRAQLGDTLERGQWHVVEDHHLEPGGFRIDSNGGDVDATLATRWKRLASTLGRGREWSDE